MGGPGPLTAVPCMSDSNWVVRIGNRILRISVEEDPEVAPAAAASSHYVPDRGEWEFVEANEPPQIELSPAVGPPPLHLLRRSRLGTAGEWTPEARIRRAFELGQSDSKAALDGSVQSARDELPLRSTVYVVLYQPSGDWPKVVRDLGSFYLLVKEKSGSKPPNRASPWKPGIYSRGFPSEVEVEAYLLGASCQLPKRG